VVMEKMNVRSLAELVLIAKRLLLKEKGPVRGKLKRFVLARDPNLLARHHKNLLASVDKSVVTRSRC
jgi:hypothetical protein